MGKIEYSNVIRSCSYDKNYILFNILQLYNGGQDVQLDPTFSKGGFYNKSKEYPVNEPALKYDLFPVRDDVLPLEKWKKWPFKSKSIQSLIIDLPFIISQGPSLMNESADNKSNIISRRYNSFYPKEEMFKTYWWYLMEAYRILKPSGICILKTQRTISGGRLIAMPEATFMYANKLGFNILDKFTLIARNRLISGKVKQQIHSRSYDSQYFVFQRPNNQASTQPIDYFDFGIFPTRHKRWDF